MVGLTKKCLRKVLGKARLWFEELETVLVEAEGVINDRPLSYIDTDTTLEALTPNHLIFGRRLLVINDGQPVERDSACVGDVLVLNKRVTYRQKVLQHFRSRWKTEYLLALRCAQRPTSRARDRVIREGDVVIVEDQSPRLFWRLGKIENVILSKDGLVRGAKVRVGTKSGERGGCVVLERPLQRLYPLEVRPDREETGPVPGHADRLSHSSGEEAQTGNGKDKRPNSALQLSDTFDEALRVASSHTETQERKSKRAAARDSDLMRNFLQHR